MNKLDKVALDIEIMRQEMHVLMQKEKYNISPKIVILSQKIDKLIVKYNRIKNDPFAD